MVLMWWKDIVNRLVHGIPLPWHVSIIWRCEECGGHVFRVLSWDGWEVNRRIEGVFALKCVECGRVEANMVVSIPVW